MRSLELPAGFLARGPTLQHLLAHLAGFRESDGDRLPATLHRAALATVAGFQGASRENFAIATSSTREAYSGRSPEDDGLGASPSGASACSARTRRIRTSKASGRKGFVTKGRWRYSAGSNAGLLVMKTNGIPSVSSILAIGNTIPSPRLISSNAKSTPFDASTWRVSATGRSGPTTEYPASSTIHMSSIARKFSSSTMRMHARHDQASPPTRRGSTSKRRTGCEEPCCSCKSPNPHATALA